MEDTCHEEAAVPAVTTTDYARDQMKHEMAERLRLFNERIDAAIDR